MIIHGFLFIYEFDSPLKTGKMILNKKYHMSSKIEYIKNSPIKKSVRNFFP